MSPNWCTVNSKSHQERLAQLNIETLGVETFLPQIREWKVIRRRQRIVVGPLFPGYLFARFDRQDLDKYYRAITYASGVRRIIAFGSTIATVGQEVIEGIRARLQSNYLTTPEQALTPGDVVRIQHGPLQGLEAVFQRRMSGHQRVVLLLGALAYQARVIAPAEHVGRV